MATSTLSSTASVRLEACFGAGLTSFSQCTLPSLTQVDFALLPDGGSDTLDAGVRGRWGLSASRRAVGLRFDAELGSAVTYCGVSTSPTCFEGFADEPGAPRSGVFRLCVN